MRFNGDEPVARVAVVFAILNVLDSGEKDATGLWEAVTHKTGRDIGRLYFEEALKGLETGGYIQFGQGRWKVINRGII